METLLSIFDELLDELASDVKEAPGWLFLIITCNIVLRNDCVLQYAKNFGIEIGADTGTIATLVGIVLFFLGDALDSFFFPREKDGKRGPKILRGIMRALAAWGFFLTIQENLWAIGVWVVFAALFPIHITLSNWGKENVKPADSASKKKEYTGVAWLAPSDLDDVRETARVRLAVDSGVYAVSKALANAAKKYKRTWIEFENESAKFIRSLVIPGLLVTFAFLYQQQWCWAPISLLMSFALFIFYGQLKGWHMQRLYRLIVEEITRDADYHRDFDPFSKKWVFYWNKKIVASAKQG